MDNLGQGKNLKEGIIESISSEEKSIAGIIKYLDEHGNKVHRLVLTGYLSAMVDFGYLKEKNLKPSRIFTYETPAGQDLYRAVGGLSKTQDGESSGDTCLLLLYFLLGRPIFMREIERCGADLPKDYKQAVTSNRTKYIEMLQKKGIRIPVNNPMIEPKSTNITQLCQLLRQMIIDHFDTNQIVDEESVGRQKTLDQD